MKPNLQPTAAEFWTFSSAHYQHPPFAAWLLAQQNNHDKNVNLALLFLYCDLHQLCLTESELQSLKNTATHFEATFLKPARTLRAACKAQQNTFAEYAKLREQLLSAELTLEKQLQAELLTCINPTPAQHAQGYFTQYLGDEAEIWLAEAKTRTF